jgi:hypothetical protein
MFFLRPIQWYHCQSAGRKVPLRCAFQGQLMVPLSCRSNLAGWMVPLKLFGLPLYHLALHKGQQFQLINGSISIKDDIWQARGGACQAAAGAPWPHTASSIRRSSSSSTALALTSSARRGRGRGRGRWWTWYRQATPPHPSTTTSGKRGTECLFL